MSRDRGSLALVLHSHMPYVEGFGTWPFGEEWLWEAIAAVYLPLIDLLSEAQAPLTLGVTPVLADQLETLPGPAGDRLAGFLAGPRAEVHERDSRGLDETGQPELAAEVRRAARDHERALERLQAPGGRDLVGALARARARHAGRAVDVLGHPRPAAAAGQRRRGAPAAGRRHRVARAPLRRASAAACGCPSAPTCPGSSASWPTWA